MKIWNLIVTQLIKKYPAFFMEPEGSSPCTQKLTTGPYPEQKLHILLLYTS
jgi:hypothetical protein